MEIRSLEKTGFDELFRAFNLAFADYEVQVNEVQLKTMLKRRGFDPELSFAAFNDNDDIMAFTLNGIGHFNRIATAYDTGTGTLKEHRGKGLATAIFEASLPFLKNKGIGQYLLEVLQHNTKAVSIYNRLGFEINREFYYFIQNNDEIGNEMKSCDFTVEKIDISAIDEFSDFHDFHPSWQNSTEAINRAPDDFVALGVSMERKIIGYCVFEPLSGDIAQIAIDRPYRRKGAGTLLLREAVNHNKYQTVKVVNTDISCSSITGFLKANNIDIKGKQFEMIKKI